MLVKVTGGVVALSRRPAGQMRAGDELRWAQLLVDVVQVIVCGDHVQRREVRLRRQLVYPFPSFVAKHPEMHREFVEKCRK